MKKWKKYIFWSMCDSWNSFDTITKEWWIDRFYYPMRSNINIWHPVMIWDVLDYIWDTKTSEIIDEKLSTLEIHKWWDYWNFEEIRDLWACHNWIMEDVIEIKLNQLWKEKRKPLEEQSLECIDYVFNLLPKE